MSAPSPSFTFGDQSKDAAAAAGSTAAAPQAHASAPPLLTGEDFARHKMDPSNIILRAFSEEEENAQEKLRANARNDLNMFCGRVETVDPAILRNQWDTAVRTSSNLDTAVRKFFIYMNAVLDTGLPKNDLETPSLLAWGRAFVKSRFCLSTLLPYAEYISALRKKMAGNGASAKCAALVLWSSFLVGLKKNIGQVDTGNLEKFRKLCGQNDRSLASLHFVCGDSGSGKTHFALHACAQKTESCRFEPIVFFCNTFALTSSKWEKHRIVQTFQGIVDLNRDSDKVKADDARERRNQAAFELLRAAMDKGLGPYMPIAETIPTAADDRANAFFILDEAIYSVPLLRALTCENPKSVAARLSEQYAPLFRRVYVLAASTVSREYTMISDSLRSSVVTYNMDPSIELAECHLREKFGALFSLWCRDPFLFFLMHDRRCATRLSAIVTENEDAFKTLEAIESQLENERKEQMRKTQEDEEKERQAIINGTSNHTKGKATKRHLKVTDAASTLSTMCFTNSVGDNGTFQPFKGVVEAEIAATRFYELMASLTDWLCAQCVMFYKSQNALRNLPPADCREIVMCGVFMGLTGTDVAALKPRTQHPLTAGLASVVPMYYDGAHPTGSPKYRIAVAHLVMALINYGDKPKEPKGVITKDESASTLSSAASDSNEEIETEANQSANAHSDQPVDGKSSETSSAECNEEETTLDLLTPGGLNVERFFHTLVPFLCNCIFHARAREQVLPFSKILEQFRWTSTEAPTALSIAEQQVWNALDGAARKMESVQQWKPTVKYPFIPSNPKTEQDGWPKMLKNEQDKRLLAFCGKSKEDEKAIHVFSNSDSASYADLIIVCGDVLLLVSSKMKVNFGDNKQEILKATATLGFSFDIDGKSYTGLKGHQYRLAGTEDLARHFGCSKVVPVFALFREPLPDLMVNLPEVNVNTKKGDSSLRLTMKPIVLFVRPQIEHAIPSKEENEKPSDTQA